MKPLLIVGIDPGTTIAYAIIDLKGNVIKAYSSRELNLDSLTASIFYVGKPLIVGTDVYPTPKFVEKFASQIGARVIGPESNLKVDQKKNMVKGLEFSNNHERDALAAAIFAFKKVRALLNKIKLYVQRYEKQDLEQDIINLVFSKNLSISDAVANLEKKAIKFSSKKPKMRTTSIKVKFDEIKYLKNQNKRLSKTIDEIRKKLIKLKENIELVSKKKAKNIIKFKDKKINFLKKELKKSKLEISKLKKEILSYKELIYDIENFILVPKFKNLNIEIAKRSNLKGIIFLEDAKSFSEKSLEIVKNKIRIVIYGRSISRKLKENFICFDLKNLRFKDFKEFLLVEKSSLEKEKRKVNIFARIIEEYKKERGLN